MSAASTGLGYAPVGDFAATVRAELEWLVACAAGETDARLLPRSDDPFFAPLLDYESEDRFLRARRLRG